MELNKSKNKYIFSLEWIKWFVLILISSITGYAVILMYAHNEIVFALLTLVLVSSGVIIFARKDTYSHRYIYPGIAALFLFIIFPLMYTIGIAFTNYSGSNQLSFERVQSQFLSTTYEKENSSYKFEIYKIDDKNFRLYFNQNEKNFVSQIISLNQNEKKVKVDLLTTKKIGKKANIKFIIKNRATLRKLVIYTKDKQLLKMSGLRTFSGITPLYKLKNDNETLLNLQNGEMLKPNFKIGNYQKVNKNGEFIGEALSPGFVVNAGLKNFKRIFLDEGIKGPFLQIFVWTVLFAALTVLFTLAVGLILATVVQWEELKGKAIYRLLLILPYAVPAFISILIFKGLFNQSFGEINALLNIIFGVQIKWFSDPTLAKTMILIVNTWLGYPYVMILCMGLLKSIPSDLYEASAIDGAGPIDNFFKITFPLIIKPLTPLLIASFAFNFNNFVLIQLLTNGSPDIIGSSTPAGHTDLLVSYTYRIAFEGGGGQDFGLASAIATIIFLMVGALALINLRVSKKQED